MVEVWLIQSSAVQGRQAPVDGWDEAPNPRWSLTFGFELALFFRARQGGVLS
jgi:hypothetical protein